MKASEAKTITEANLKGLRADWLDEVYAQIEEEARKGFYSCNLDCRKAGRSVEIGGIRRWTRAQEVALVGRLRCDGFHVEEEASWGFLDWIIVTWA